MKESLNDVSLSLEGESAQEKVTEVENKKVGKAILRVGDVSGLSEEKSRINAFRSYVFELLERNSDDGDGFSDEEEVEFERMFKDYVDAVNSERSWEENLQFLTSVDLLNESIITECVKGGMPISLMLRDDAYWGYLDFSILPEGSLSEAYRSASETDEGRERFKKEFIDDHRVDSAVASYIYDAINNEGELSEKQKEDISVFQEMGGNSLNAAIVFPNKDYLQYNFGETYAKEREAGKKIFDCLFGSGLCDEKVAGEFFSQTIKSLGKRDNPLDMRLGVIDGLLDSGLDPVLDGDADYWFQICGQRQENALEHFEHLFANKGELFDEFDFENEVVLRTLANVLSNETIWGERSRSFYREMSRRKLLDSEVFQEELVRAVSEHAEREKEYPRVVKGEVSMGVLALLMRRDLLDEIGSKGLFEKYPGCMVDETLGGFIDGQKTEQDRLTLFINAALFTYSGKSDQFDERGEPLDGFYDGIDSSEEAAPFLSDEEKRRLCEILFEKGAYSDLSSAGEELWDVEGLSGAVKGFLRCCETLKVDDVLTERDIHSERLEDFFDESGVKEGFWRECINRGKFDYLAKRDKEALRRVGCDEYTCQLFRGMGSFDLGEEGGLNEENALSALVRFIQMDAADWGNANEADLKIKYAFAEGNIANKDVVMRQLRRVYEDYLDARDDTKMPPSFRLLVEFMHKNGGAGPLTQIEALLNYCGELDKVENNEIRLSTRGLEDRIRGWDNVSKANFYTIAADILRADEQIYTEFLSVFERIKDEKDFRVFTQEIFPLYRAKLALLREYEDNSDGVGNGYQVAHYRNVNMEKLRNDLHTALIPFTFLSKGEGEDDESFKERREKGTALVKEKIFGEITELFTEKFGILPDAIPHELDKDGMRVIEDMVMYLSNIKAVDGQKKSLIGFYLALQLARRKDGSSAWDAFRKGVDCSPFDYLSPDAARGVADAIRRSGEMNPITMENTHIEGPERLGEFRSALQESTSEIRVGGMSTIDVKLQNLCSNIEELADPDLYGTTMDKAKVRLISQYSPRTINKVSTALWLREAKGREPIFSEDEVTLADELEKLLADEGIEFTPENIQKYLQQGFKELGPVVKTLALIDERDVRGKVAKLQDMLAPTGEVAAIFGELGEEFRPESGVFALNADLEFLRSIIAKGEKVGALSGDVTERQRKLAVLNEYLATIESSMSELDAIYNEIVKSFDSIRAPSEDREGNQGVASKLQEIRDIISGKSGSSYPVIVSNCSNSMNIIVENMRVCLSCKTKGINNDTNLTFGEGYKFYLYSQTGAREKGSISDEIVYFVPTRSNDGEQRMSFVMDMIYGTKNRDVLLGHVGVLAKKARALKKSFPKVPISIFVTSNGASSCSVPIESEGLLAQLQGLDGVSVEVGDRTVNIPESGFGDHYIEIGHPDYCRKAGERNVSGIEIVF